MYKEGMEHVDIFMGDEIGNENGTNGKVRDKRERELKDNETKKHPLNTWDTSNRNEWLYRSQCATCHNEFTTGLTVSAMSANPEKDKGVQAQMRKIEQETQCWNCKRGGV